MVTFAVAGHPVTQGSKRGFVVNGRAVLVEAGGDRHRLWRHAVNDQARRTWTGPPLTGPVVLELAFRLQRPASHPKRRRTWPVGRRSGDWDKLGRLVSDALAGVAYVDDAQVVDGRVVKDWAAPGEPPGVTITIGEVLP
jgi:Holliday junction resolvase RusA-like endonuclease